MTVDDQREFVHVVEEGLLDLAEESMAPPADLAARIRGRVTRRRRRGALRLSVAALACAAAAVPIGWSDAGGSPKAVTDGSSKPAAVPVPATSPTQAATSQTGAPSWWPLTDGRFARLHPTAALTDFWDKRTGRHHTDVRALETIPFGNKSLILLVGHSSDGTSLIGLMAGFVLPDDTVSSYDAEFFTEQTVTSPSAPIAIAAHPLSDSRSASTVTIVSPACPVPWRITTGQVAGKDAAAAYREDPYGDLILTKVVPPQSFVTTHCGNQTFLFGPERESVAASGTKPFELLTQR